MKSKRDIEAIAREISKNCYSHMDDPIKVIGACVMIMEGLIKKCPDQFVGELLEVLEEIDERLAENRKKLVERDIKLRED